MSTQLFNTESPQVDTAISLVPTEPQAFMAVLARAATDPSVDVSKMEKLWEIYRSIVAWHAEKAFNVGFSEMQSKLPVITEHGKIEHNSKLISEYALFEDINDAVKPILQEFGFGLMFKTDDSNPDKVRVIGVLTHKEGHREETPYSLPADTSGAKNAVQAHGSSISYAKRYILTGLLNITTRGEDDDGQTGGAKLVTEDQQATLQALIDEVKQDKDKFFRFVSSKAKRQIKKLSEIPDALYADLVKGLEKKRSA